jgi:ethanolamine permease
MTESTGLVKSLRPYHVWALGVGIVLVGEYMGWNFTIAKGGVLGSLFAMLVAGTMYIMISLCASELGSSTKLAGGPYDWARLFIGPGAAASVGLAVYMEYIALQAADAIVVAFIAQEIWPNLQVFPITLLVIATLTFINYRGVVAALTLNFFMTAIAFLAIIIFFFSGTFGVFEMNPERLFQGVRSFAVWSMVLPGNRRSSDVCRRVQATFKGSAAGTAGRNDHSAGRSCNDTLCMHNAY